MTTTTEASPAAAPAAPSERGRSGVRTDIQGLRALAVSLVLVYHVAPSWLHGGFVGPGMLDAACAGEVFTSPVPDQMLAATQGVDGGAGVLHVVKNYTGDVMNFEMAAELAADDGIPVEAVVTDDDVAVQDSLYTAGRRGVGVTVLLEKIAGAAADEGRDLKAVADTNSLLQDWAFDPRRRQLYMADPAGGVNAALVVVDLRTGQARRVLQGDRSVVNEDTVLVADGRELRQKLPDGRVIHPKLGVDGIAIDYAREWVYYGAVMSRTMYRVRAADLANPALSSADLAARVERYATKPRSDGMLLDRGFQLLNPGYPRAPIDLDLDALRLRTFEAGAVVARGTSRQVLADPRRSPRDLLPTVSTSLGTVAQRARLAAWIAEI